MPEAFLILILFQLLGSALQITLRLPVPGPVIGMFLLAAALLWKRSRTRADTRVSSFDTPALSSLSRSLIACLGLLFVPAGVGLVTQMPVLLANGLPIAVALFGSTLLGLMVTAFVMHKATHDRPSPERIPDTGGQVL
ncbi:CidA/LrgA family protein [Acetobacter sp.]|jgi:holin-like protein|uniref:CidA/LrgA family protein n=1 Tax=Acetobacter sp. TaxID=440 RepID=UPI0025B9C534|nr:CidA/LrgA family protein [Acetobacter sp.]MCH4090362.1 CidA/LrgA family protein [Acetobacter sp.]MCI1299056.1 CidA/LrgA family protein [Acetobacter sp.]MCI1315603.1 CidA/LrgA family protein [Acetobacter sp.]